MRSGAAGEHLLRCASLSLRQRRLNERRLSRALQQCLSDSKTAPFLALQQCIVTRPQGNAGFLVLCNSALSSGQQRCRPSPETVADSRRPAQHIPRTRPEVGHPERKDGAAFP